MKDLTADEVVTKLERRPTIRALLYVVGSACIELFRESMYVSLRKGPYTRPPRATLRVDLAKLRNLKPSVQAAVAPPGIEAPLCHSAKFLRSDGPWFE